MTTIVDPKVGVTYRTILLRAADEIRRNGHCKTRAFGPEGICIMTALNWVPCDGSNFYDVLLAIRRVIGDETLIDWNFRQDAKSVIQMLERAAL